MCAETQPGYAKAISMIASDYFKIGKALANKDSNMRDQDWPKTFSSKDGVVVSVV